MMASLKNQLYGSHGDLKDQRFAMITSINIKNGQLWKSCKFKGSRICNDNSNQY